MFNLKTASWGPLSNKHLSIFLSLYYEFAHLPFTLRTTTCTYLSALSGHFPQSRTYSLIMSSSEDSNNQCCCTSQPHLQGESRYRMLAKSFSCDSDCRRVLPCNFVRRNRALAQIVDAAAEAGDTYCSLCSTNTWIPATTATTTTFSTTSTQRTAATSSSSTSGGGGGKVARPIWAMDYLR